MAEIDVQKKSSSHIWAWILGLIVLGIVIWMLVGRSDSDDLSGVPSETPAAEQPVSPPATAPVDTVRIGTGTGY